MSILQQLQKPLFKASKGDKILLQYIKSSAEDFCISPIATIAKSCGVSEATITRFVRKMGFANLQLFKLSLNEEISNAKRNASIISGDICCKESIGDTANKLLINNIHTLEATVKKLHEESLVDVVRLMQRANRVFFVGLGNSGFVADDSAYKFLRIGVDAKGLDNSHLIMLYMAILNEGDLVIAITHSGETLEIIRAAQLAKKNGIKFVVITANRNTVLQKYANVCVFYESEESALETGSVTTKLTQIFIIDLIYTQLVKEDMECCATYKTLTAEAINTLGLSDDEIS